MMFDVIEARFGIRHGGHRFWLFLFNLLVTPLTAVGWLFWFRGWPSAIMVGFLLFLIVGQFNITAYWNELTKWRGKK